MARRRYRRYRRRSGRWSPNIVKIAAPLPAVPGEFYGTEDLAVNNTSNSNGVATVFTVKNFEITFTLESQQSNYLEAVTAYIMFVPQGMSITSSYYADHPEYIMAYKYIGSPNVSAQSGSTTVYENQQYQPYRIKTRLSRKLQTGDRVVLFIQGSSESTINTTLDVYGIVRWWSKSN